jgi:hypothetical protein
MLLLLIETFKMNIDDIIMVICMSDLLLNDGTTSLIERLLYTYNNLCNSLFIKRTYSGRFWRPAVYNEQLLHTNN